MYRGRDFRGRDEEEDEEETTAATDVNSLLFHEADAPSSSSSTSTTAPYSWYWLVGVLYLAGSESVNKIIWFALCRNKNNKCYNKSENNVAERHGGWWRRRKYRDPGIKVSASIPPRRVMVHKPGAGEEEEQEEVVVRFPDGQQQQLLWHLVHMWWASVLCELELIGRCKRALYVIR